MHNKYFVTYFHDKCKKGFPYHLASYRQGQIQTGFVGTLPRSIRVITRRTALSCVCLSMGAFVWIDIIKHRTNQHFNHSQTEHAPELGRETFLR